MLLTSMSCRMPPEFIKAILALPVVGPAVAASWASAITSPSVDSPSGLGVRVRWRGSLPVTCWARGAAASTYCWTTVATSGSALGGSSMRLVLVSALREFSTTVLVAEADASSPVALSTVRVRSVKTRPNEAALVTRRVTVEPSLAVVVIVQRYSAWVWPDTMTLIAGSSFLAMTSMSLPARLPAQLLVLVWVAFWMPPWWITSTGILTPWALRAWTALLASAA